MRASRRRMRRAYGLRRRELDLDTTLPGNETERWAFLGCPDNGAAELWTIRGATHQPALDDAFAERVSTWLMAHSKP